MKKDVLVKVIGTQTNDIGEQDKIELITEGTFYSREKDYYIIYNESAISGMEGTTTSLKVESNRVTLNRMGTQEQKQVFQEGVTDRGLYITPFGTMYMSVIPSKVLIDLTDSGGSINLEYELMVEQEKVSYNQLDIIISNL